MLKPHINRWSRVHCHRCSWRILRGERFYSIFMNRHEKGPVYCFGCALVVED